MTWSLHHLETVSAFSQLFSCATRPRKKRSRVHSAQREMRLYRPRLRVSQAQSAFAAGNNRWTNRDLDPIPLHARRWGVSSLIGTDLGLVPSLDNCDLTVSSILDLRCVQCSNMAVCQQHHRRWIDIPRGTGHRGHLLLHHLRHRRQRCRRCHLPRPVSCDCPRELGLLGLVYRDHLTINPCRLLVRHPEC